jgi:hypothetical protein
VASEDIGANATTIITVYVPDAEKWDKSFKSRRA